MRVTGYQLREAVKQQVLQRDRVARAFPGSLKAFKDEPPEESPQQLGSTLVSAENAIARLQTVQMRYNLSVRVTVGGETMPLAAAVKMLGGVQRAEKMWRAAATPKTERLYGSDERTSDTVVKKPTISAKEAQEQVITMARQASALRQAIAVANATAIDIEDKDLDASLFG